MVFFHQYLPLLMQLEKGRRRSFITVLLCVLYHVLMIFRFPFLLFTCNSYRVSNLQDGTWDSVKKSCIIVRDFGDVCYHSYSSYMHDLQGQQPPDRKYYEIRFALFLLPEEIFLERKCFHSVPIHSFT